MRRVLVLMALLLAMMRVASADGGFGASTRPVGGVDGGLGGSVGEPPVSSTPRNQPSMSPASREAAGLGESDGVWRDPRIPVPVRVSIPGAGFDPRRYEAYFGRYGGGYGGGYPYGGGGFSYAGSWKALEEERVPIPNSIKTWNGGGISLGAGY